MNGYLGVDPGQKGALAFFGERGNCEEFWCLEMFLAGKEIDGGAIARMLRQNTGSFYDDKPGITLAAVEWAQAMPKQGVTSCFNYGAGFGKVLGVLEALEIPYRLVRPRAWKEVILAGTAKDKEAAIAYVRRAYPWANLTPGKKRKPHDGMADALCLAEYAQRVGSCAPAP